MKFCKDCAYYVAPIVGDGGSLLPGFIIDIPAKCNALIGAVKFDLVSGEEIRPSLDCSKARQDPAICGAIGASFIPARKT